MAGSSGLLFGGFRRAWRRCARMRSGPRRAVLPWKASWPIPTAALEQRRAIVVSAGHCARGQFAHSSSIVARIGARMSSSSHRLVFPAVETFVQPSSAARRNCIVRSRPHALSRDCYEVPSVRPGVRLTLPETLRRILPAVAENPRLITWMVFYSAGAFSVCGGHRARRRFRLRAKPVVSS